MSDEEFDPFFAPWDDEKADENDVDECIDTSLRDVSIPQPSSNIDSLVKFWIRDAPYLWVTDSKSIFRGCRYYFTNVDDTVYTLSRDNVYLPKEGIPPNGDSPNEETWNFDELKSYELEFRMREGEFPAERPIYRVKFKSGTANHILNLFRVYNPYSVRVPISNVSSIDVRINGERIAYPEHVFLSELDRIQFQSPRFQPTRSIALRYLGSIPSNVVIVPPRGDNIIIS